METVNVQRQVVIDAIDALPPAALAELWVFIEYLRFKLAQLSEASTHLADHQPPAATPTEAEGDGIQNASPYDILSKIAAMPVESKTDQFVGNVHDQTIYTY
jgi:hypothetical protein